MTTLNKLTYMALTDAQIAALEVMNNGAYLIKKNNQEGATYDGHNQRIQTLTKKGTIDTLLAAGLIREHLVTKGKFLLTDEGRKYRHVEK